jgi:hypothetical protein
MKICKFWSGNCDNCPLKTCPYEPVDDEKILESDDNG